MKPHSGKMKPSVEYIVPSLKLRAKTGQLPRNSWFDPIAEAERELKKKAAVFAEWMKDEVDLLMDNWRTFSAKDHRDEEMERLVGSVHEIKSQAAILGYPRAGEVAASLVRLFEYVPNPADWPITLVEQHILSIRAIMAEAGEKQDDSSAIDLVKVLTEVTNEFVLSKYSSAPVAGESTEVALAGPRELARKI